MIAAGSELGGKEVGGIQVPGTPWATPPAELEKLAAYERDIAASRAEARRLLREAGVPESFAFTALWLTE